MITSKTSKQIMIKRWIALPKPVAEKIAEIARRENRSDKAQTEVLIMERLREIEALAVAAAVDAPGAA